MSKEVKYPGDDPMSYLGLTPGTPEWEEVSRRREYAMDTDEELVRSSVGLERRSDKPKVAGSNPAGPTNVTRLNNGGRF